jgi:membrane protein
MSDAKIHWGSVLPGAAFTALLFALGKYLIGLYLSESNIADTYGAAASIVIVLAWVFYSSQVLFFGAEFTHALSREKGKLLDPIAMKQDTDKGIEALEEISDSQLT